MAQLDISSIKKDFPLLSQGGPGKKGVPRLVYLDSAATSQLPLTVINAMEHYYSTTHANVHRGVYTIAEEATRLFEDARLKVGEFINAPNPEREIVFTKNVTESINLVAQSWGRGNLKPADVVLLSEMEHHANIVPWQIMASQIGFEIRYLKITDDGYLILDDLKRQLDGVKLVGITLMSNVLGTINDISEIVAMAHDAGALVLADGAQFVPHLPTDVAQIGCDFLAFTGHKMLGPTGIGILWAPTDILDKMPPFLGGGEMIADVTLEGFRPTEIPWKFEAGTPPIAEAVGLLEAVKYLKNIGMSKIREHEIEMIEYTFDHLKKRFGDDLSIHGPKDAKHRGGVFSFAYKDVHPHDLAQILDSEGICIRAGHHCAKPLMRRLGVTSTARASVYIYNDFNDIVALGDGLGKVKDIFG